VGACRAGARSATAFHVVDLRWRAQPPRGDLARRVGFETPAPRRSRRRYGGDTSRPRRTCAAARPGRRSAGRSPRTLMPTRPPPGATISATSTSRREKRWFSIMKPMRWCPSGAARDTGSSNPGDHRGPRPCLAPGHAHFLGRGAKPGRSESAVADRAHWRASAPMSQQLPVGAGTGCGGDAESGAAGVVGFAAAASFWRSVPIGGAGGKRQRDRQQHRPHGGLHRRPRSRSAGPRQCRQRSVNRMRRPARGRDGYVDAKCFCNPAQQAW
jgi:hypothetical protein